jgi:hypothetical protein
LRVIAIALAALSSTAIQVAAAYEPVESAGALANVPAPPEMPTQPPYRPHPGDKLGYSRSESIARLDSDVRRFLDGVLRLYREPGLVAHRILAIAALGARSSTRRVHQVKYDGRLYETFADDFVLTDPRLIEWRGKYIYEPRLRDPNEWRIEISVRQETWDLCIDSRAVEGYLDLYLQPHLDGYATPLPARLWNRHGSFGKPYAEPLRPDTPALELYFEDGCLRSLHLGRNFLRQDLNDDHVY